MLGEPDFLDKLETLSSLESLHVRCGNAKGSGDIATEGCRMNLMFFFNNRIDMALGN